MYDRPPVMQKAQFEDGSFGLDGSIRSLKLKFSRQMDIDNPDNVETRTKCIVYVNDEIWDRTWNAADSTLTLTRPEKYKDALSGDYLIEINNLYIPNTDRKADDVAIHYNFGPINRDLSSISFGAPIWDAKFYDETVNPNDKSNATKPLSPNGTAIYFYKDGWGGGWTYNVLNGTTEVNAARLYRYSDSTLTNLRALMVCPRNSSTNPARLYLGLGSGFDINLTAGNYVITYKAQPVNKLFGFKIYVYPWVADPRNVDAADKVLISEHGAGAFARYYNESLVKNATNNVDTILTTQFKDGFQIEKNGKYIVEIHVDPASGGDGGYPSMLFSNFELNNSPVSFGPISVLNNAVDAAQARVALAAEAKYAGPALRELNALIDQYKVGGTFSSTKPSDWQNAAKVTVDATEAFKLRMDTVDLVVAKAKELADKLTSAAAENANWAELIDYETLVATKAIYDAYPFAEKTNAELTAFIKQMDDEIKALDARIAATKEFNVAKKDAQALVEAKEKESFTEYGDLKDIYEEYEDFDTLKTADDALNEALAAVTAAVKSYKFAVGISEVGTRRVQELAALATKLGSTVADSAVISERLAELRTDDDYLAEVFKAAIKAALYEKGKTVESEDLSPFIKNYYLYATVPGVTEMLDKNQTDNRDDFKYNKDKHGDARIVHTNHKWNKVEIWMTMTNADFTDLLPGWTFKAVNVNGNDMVYVDSLNKNTNLKVATEKPVFDGAISMDWNSQADMSTKVVGLPAGEFELGVDVRSSYTFGNRTAKGVGSLAVKCDTIEASADLITTYLDTVTYTLAPIDTLPGQFDTIAVDNNHTNDTTVFQKVDFSVIDGKSLYINATVKTNNGSGQIDNFKLTYKPSATFDYAAAVEAAKADVVRIITVVDVAKAQKANVEYYTLGGLKVDAAKAGQILIRKTTDASGKVVVDKVLLK
jgi:hypothetical protein